MTREDYILLYEKLLAGNISPAERQLLEDYKDDYQFLEHEWHPSMGAEDDVREKIYNRLQGNLDIPFRRKRVSNGYYWVAAASVLLIFSVLLLRSDVFLKKNNLQQQASRVKTDVPPGSTRAVLTLANGETVNLDNTGNGTTIRQGNTDVTKPNNGHLCYASISKSTPGQVLYNSARTPKGGTYELILSDGTKVWLNAASSLRFPVAFSGKERRVELSGEAYFEVAKNKAMPFKVVTEKQEIQVLGTHFNVNAYADENAIKTTLLEGSVKISTSVANKGAVLKPGEQSTITGNSLSVANVDVSDAVAWKNGDFKLNEDLESIMKKLSRWYNVEVVFKTDEYPSLKFGGTISRSKSLASVLQIMEATGNIHFKIEGRTVFVMK